MDLRELKDSAQALFDKKSYAKASEAYGKACAAAPQDLQLRQRWALALRRAGHDRQAFGILREVAAAYANEGELLRAIAVNKLLLEIEPSHTETQHRLAQLYSRRETPVREAVQPRPAPVKRKTSADDATVSGRTLRPLTQVSTDDDRPAPRRSPRSKRPAAKAKAKPDLDDDAPTDPGRDLPEDWAEITDELVIGGLPKPSWSADQVDRVKLDSPLFENLDPETFIELLQKCKRRAFSAGEVLIRQGASARSFFVLINGELRVVQGPLEDADSLIELARLSPRDFFGEMALVSRSPRMASVVAVTEGDALEFPDTMLDKLVARSPAAKTALREFIRARLLENAMASSEIFRPFDRTQRRHLFARFSVMDVAAGTSLLAQGKAADGFYVIMEGSFRVDRDGEMLSTFGVGDTFGEISLLTRAPATAGVIAEVPGRVLRLSAPAFRALVATHPSVQRFAKDLEHPRATPARHVSSNKVASDIAGLVLV